MLSQADRILQDYVFKLGSVYSFALLISYYVNIGAGNNA
jgi:hypothetical protein